MIPTTTVVPLVMEECPICGEDTDHNECHSGYCEFCCPDCWGTD